MTRAATEADDRARRGLRLEDAFPALAAVFGLLFLVATPPLQAPDELRHLQRVFAINSGQLLATPHSAPFDGVFVPRDLAELEEDLGAGELRRRPGRRQNRVLLREALERPFDSRDRIYVGVPSLYSPIAYLPSALGVGAARLLDLSAALCVYAGRLFNAIAYAALVGLALRRSPAHRIALGMLAVTPMAVFEGASLGVDGITNALALLFVVSVLRTAAASGPLRRAEWIELCALAALVGLAKQAYAPLALIAFALPASRFANPRERWIGQIAVVAAGVVPTALWFAALRGLDPGPLTHGANPAEQVAFVLDHPLRVAGVLLDTLVAHFGRYARTFVGQLGSLDVWLPAAVYAIYPFVLVAVSVFDGGRGGPLQGRGRAIFAGVAAIGWLSVMLLAYVGWNLPSDVLVRYVQGRYFIPIAPLIACAIAWPSRSRLPRTPALLAIASATLVLGLASIAVVQRYWLI